MGKGRCEGGATFVVLRQCYPDDISWDGELPRLALPSVHHQLRRVPTAGGLGEWSPPYSSGTMPPLLLPTGDRADGGAVPGGRARVHAQRPRWKGAGGLCRGGRPCWCSTASLEEDAVLPWTTTRVVGGAASGSRSPGTGRTAAVVDAASGGGADVDCTEGRLQGRHRGQGRVALTKDATLDDTAGPSAWPQP